MFWLYLLGLSVFLVIALRRVRRRQEPLSAELYSKKVAVEYVQSGVAWVSVDGKLGSMNSAFAKALGADPELLADRDWLEVFAPQERTLAKESYSRMLLVGRDSFDAVGLRFDGSEAWFNVLLVAVHDSKARLVGHHCMIDDRSRERELEERVRQLTDDLMGVRMVPRRVRTSALR
jgi:PAS domain S-box-containing protein